MNKSNASHFAVPVYKSAFCGARSKIGHRVVNGADAESIAADVVIVEVLPGSWTTGLAIHCGSFGRHSISGIKQGQRSD